MKKQKTIICGGSGYIGSFLIDYFTEKGIDFAVCDIKKPKQKVKFIKSDFSDIKVLKKTIKPYNNVIHLVGYKCQDKVQENPNLSFKLNIVSLHNLLEASKGKKIVFPSSSHVYGTDKKGKIKEQAKLNPDNLYGWHKLICEKMILSYQQSFDIDYVILRLFKVYGSGEKAMIASFLKNAKKNKSITIYNGEQKRDIVHGKDVAIAFYNSLKIKNKIINIASGKPRTIKEYAEIAAGLYPKTKIKNIKKGKSHNMIADISLLRRYLKFKPKSSKEFLENSIKEINKNI